MHITLEYFAQDNDNNNLSEDKYFKLTTMIVIKKKL